MIQVGEAFEKQIKSVEGQGRYQFKAFKVLKPAQQQHKPKLTEEIFPKELKNDDIL